MPFLSSEADSRPHGFLVLGDGAASGVLFKDGTELGTLGTVRRIDTWVDDWLEVDCITNGAR